MQKLILAILSMFFACSLTQAQGTAGECPDEALMEAGVTITYGDALLRAEPASVRVCAGGRITITLVPEAGYDVMEVERKARKKEEKWLKKAVRAVDLKEKEKRRQFKIKVPEGQPAGIYKYYVKVPGVGYLDPRVEVVDSHSQ
jgi:hypothetical protein